MVVGDLTFSSLSVLIGFAFLLQVILLAIGVAVRTTLVNWTMGLNRRVPARGAIRRALLAGRPAASEADLPGLTLASAKAASSAFGLVAADIVLALTLLPLFLAFGFALEAAGASENVASVSIAVGMIAFVLVLSVRQVRNVLRVHRRVSDSSTAARTGVDAARRRRQGQAIGGVLVAIGLIRPLFYRVTSVGLGLAAVGAAACVGYLTRVVAPLTRSSIQRIRDLPDAARPKQITKLRAVVVLLAAPVAVTSLPALLVSGDVGAFGAGAAVGFGLTAFRWWLLGIQPRSAPQTKLDDKQGAEPGT